MNPSILDPRSSSVQLFASCLQRSFSSLLLWPRWRRYGALVAAIILTASPVLAWATPPGTLIVDTLTDTTHSPNDCATGSASSCSLRDAIAQANTNSGGNIYFKVGLTGAVTLSSALPTITANNVTITGLTSGSGASISNLMTVEGASSAAIFVINSGVTGTTIFNLRVVSGQKGSAISNQGALSVSSSTFLSYSAANPTALLPPPNTTVSAIINTTSGTLTISGCTFIGNTAYLGGGAIENNGTAAITNSTFSGNSATSTKAGTGGAISNTGTLTIANSTFSGNSAVDFGGAILNFGLSHLPGVLEVTNSIFAGNSAPAGMGGGIYNDGGTVTESGNLFYDNAGGDTAYLTLSSTDLTGQDPKLAPLGWYGGPTQTFIPLPGSAALCIGSAANLPAGLTTDQRGYPLDPSCPSGNVDAGAVQVNPIVVNTLNDSSDGSCTSTTCSLRDAVTAVNSGQMGEVGFAPGLSGTISLTSALPAITSVLNLLGPGAQTLTVSGGGSLSVGSIFIVTTGAYADFYGLTIANGDSHSGGAINNNGTVTVSNSRFSGHSADLDGGAIISTGTLTVINSTFSNNSATSSTSGVGGAIYSEGPLTVANSTFSGNSGTGAAGAIYEYRAGTITNSTFFGNSVTGNSSEGGAIFTAGTLTIANSTFSGNSAQSTGGAIAIYGNGSSDPGALTITNTIVSGNSASDSGAGGIFNYGGIVTDNDNIFYNNAGGDVTGLTLSSTDKTGTTANPYLSALGWYGGPTQTMIPLTGSAALGAGSFQSGEPITDQRGAPRPSVDGQAIDIGAVQITGNPPTVTAVTPNNGSTAGGTSVVITGTGLDSLTGVSFGGTAATSFTVTAATSTAPASISAISPPETAGTVDVTVTDSNGTSAVSQVDEFTFVPPAATPSMTPGTGTYNSAQSVTISDSISNATIYYTTDGSIPTTASSQYSGAITVSVSETVKAIAVASGYASSAVTSATYTLPRGFTAGSGGTTSLSVSPGATTGNTATISLVAINGFSGSVSLTCTVTTSMTGVTDMPTCSLNPASVTLSGTAPSTSTLTIGTVAPTSAQNQQRNLFWHCAGGTALALLLIFAVPRRRFTWQALLGLFVLSLAVGCGGGGHHGGGGGGGGGSTGTTAGIYTVTVTGTSGTINAQVGTVTVTVL